MRMPNITTSPEELTENLFSAMRQKIVRKNLQRVGKYGLRKNKSRTDMAKHAAAGPLLNAQAETVNESLAKGVKDHKPAVDQAKPVGYFLTSHPHHLYERWSDAVIPADKESRRQGRAVAIMAQRADGSVYVQVSILHRGD